MGSLILEWLVFADGLVGGRGVIIITTTIIIIIRARVERRAIYRTKCFEYHKYRVV